MKTVLLGISEGALTALTSVNVMLAANFGHPLTDQYCDL